VLGVFDSLHFVILIVPWNVTFDLIEEDRLLDGDFLKGWEVAPMATQIEMNLMKRL